MYGRFISLSFQSIFFLFITGLLVSCGGDDTATPNDIHICDNTFTSIEIGGVSTDAVLEDKSKCYSFGGVAGATYSLSLTTLSGDSDIGVYSSPDFSEDSLFLYSIEQGLAPDEVSFTSVDTSTYYIEVNGFEASEYSLAINIVKPIAEVSWNGISPVLYDVALNASASSDAGGQSLTYQWTLSNKPTGSTASLANTDQVTTSFFPDMTGLYEFTLVANNGIVDSEVFTGQVNIFNTKPVAAVDDVTEGAIGQETIIDGRNSVDADGHTLEYEWVLVSRPANSNLIWSSQSGETASFDADVFGDYSFQLSVSDPFLQSDPVTTTVTVGHKFDGLNFRVTDAEYSDALESIVIVSADDQALYIYDVVSKTTVTVALPHAPKVVSVSPDGLFAAVGYNGWISHVDLNAASLLKTFPISVDVYDIALDANGNVHMSVDTLGEAYIYSANIATEAEARSTGSPGLTSRMPLVLHPNGPAVYGLTIYSPSDIKKVDISTGTGVYAYDSPYHGEYSMCGGLWLSEDTLRMLTACGYVFKTSGSKALDMLYSGRLENVGGKVAKAMDHSSEEKQLSVIYSSVQGTSDSTTDTRIHFYNYDYLTDDGFDVLPKFTAGSLPFLSHAKFVFYKSDGTQYFTIVQADNESGLLDDYAILSSTSTGDVIGGNRRPAANAGLNSAVVTASTIDLDGSLSSDADGDTLSYEWTVIDKPVGAIPGLVNSLNVTAQFTPDIEGAYTLGLMVSDDVLTSIQDTVIVTAISSGSTYLMQADYDVTDAEYSDALEKIIMVSGTDNSLYTFDTATYRQTRLQLPLAATSVSISPDGMNAAVGHNGWVSYVNLSSNTIIKTFSVTANVLDLVLDGNGYVHVLPYHLVAEWERIRSINISTETESLSLGDQFRSGALARIHPNGASIYLADNNIYPQDIRKFDISSGRASFLYDSPYHGDYSMCGDLWLSEDGLRVFSRCGNVFRSSNDPLIDMTYNGTLENHAGEIVALSHSNEASSIAVISRDLSISNPDLLLDTKIQFYNYDLLTQSTSVALPKFTAGINTYTSHGRHVFYNSVGTRYFSVVEAEESSGLLNRFGIVIH